MIVRHAARAPDHKPQKLFGSIDELMTFDFDFIHWADGETGTNRRVSGSYRALRFRRYFGGAQLMTTGAVLQC